MKFRRRLVAGLVIAVVLSLTAYFTVVNPYGTWFHLEQAMPNPARVYHIELKYLHDTNLTISFANDSGLFYRIDVELYRPMLMSEAFILKQEDSYPWFTFAAKTRIKSLNLVLSNSIPAYLIVRGTDLNSNITYSNGVKLSSRDPLYYGYLYYYASGTVRFTLLEDVDISGGGLEVQIGTDAALPFPKEVYLYVDLPEGINGELRLHDCQYTITNVMDGWYLRYDGAYTRWSTKFVESWSTIDFGVRTEKVHLWMFD